MTERIKVGKIGAAHGIKGLVRLSVYAEDPGLLEKEPLFTTKEGQTTLSVTLKNRKGNMWLAAIEGVTDRTAAQALTHTELWLSRSALPVPGEGEHLVIDLIGMDVRHKDGRMMGKLVAVPDFGAGDLLEVQPEEGESFYVPFTDEVVPSINKDDRIITIDWTPL